MEKSISLYYKEGSSDKVYQASLEKKDKGFVVNFAFGRRGSTLKTGTKTNVAVDFDEADKVYQKLINEKMGKGYLPIDGDVTQYQHTDKEQRKTNIFCQLLNPIEESEVEKYLKDDNYVAQEKMDGKRNLLSKENGELTAINRKSLSVGFPETYNEALKIKENFIIDGEAIGDDLFIFDILSCDDDDLKNESFEKRYEILSKMFKKFSKVEAFKLVEVAVTTAEKTKLFKDLKKKGAEGIVFKLKSAKYTAGRPASGGTQIKFKFVETASFVVLKENKKRSVEVGLFDFKDKKALISVGNVTIPPNKDVPAKGDIIEVQYLYAYKGGSIYQPVYIGLRDDIDDKECKIEQLKYKNTPVDEDDDEN